MRLLAAVLLLAVQLGPVAGAAVCLHDALVPAATECPMGEQAHPVTEVTATVSEPGGPTPPDMTTGGCALAGFCLSTTVTTVPEPLPVDFRAVQLRVALAAAESPFVTQAGSPPFHPPMV